MLLAMTFIAEPAEQGEIVVTRSRSLEDLRDSFSSAILCIIKGRRPERKELSRNRFLARFSGQLLSPSLS